MKQEEIDNLKFDDKVSFVLCGIHYGIFINIDDDGDYKIIFDSGNRVIYFSREQMSNVQLYKKEPKFKHVQRFMSKSDIRDIVEFENAFILTSDTAYGRQNVPVIISFRSEDVE